MLATLADLDRSLFCAINAGWSHPALDQFFGLATYLGDSAVLAVIGVLALYAFDRKNFPKNFLILAVILLLGGQFIQLLKSLFGRPRPLKDPVLGAMMAEGVSTQVIGWLDKLTVPLSAVGERMHVIGPHWKYRAFPSGHTYAVFAFATAIVMVYRKRVWWLLYLPAALVGLSRVYIGVHFPGDVVAGAVVGVAWAWGAILATRKYTGMGYRRPEGIVVSSSPPDQPLIMIVAGEASADTYAANLIRAVQRQVPGARFIGIGGENAEATGMEMLGDAADISIVGFTGVVVGLGKIRRLYLAALKAMEQRKPDVLVCIDLPDFNLALANQAKARGVAVLYYISPQIWAWRTGRVRTIADRIDHIIVALPFERDFYQQHDVSVSFAGHPILETIQPRYENREQARQAFGLDVDKQVVVVAPGSRSNETKYLTHTLAAGAKLAAERSDNLQFVVPLAPTVDVETVKGIFQSHGVEPVYTRGDFFDLLACADAGVITSGTATLEAALAGLPHIIAYRGHALNVAIARRLVKLDKIGLPNIILGRVAFPELIQHDCNPESVADWIDKMVTVPERQTLLGACHEVRERLSGGDVSGHVAEQVLRLVKQRKEQAS